MSKKQKLRALVRERLTAAAEEIFELVERTITEYEEELCRSKEENQRQQQLLEENQRRQQLLEENQRRQQLLEENQRRQQLLEENQRRQQLLENQRRQQLLKKNQRRQQLLESQRRQQLLEKNQRRQQLLEENQRRQQLLEEVQSHDHHGGADDEYRDKQFIIKNEPEELSIDPFTYSTVRVKQDSEEPTAPHRDPRDLRGRDLRDLRGRDPRNLKGCDPRDSDLRGHDPRDSDLRDHEPRDSDVRGHDPRDSDLRGHDPRDSDLRGHDSRDSDPRNLAGVDHEEHTDWTEPWEPLAEDRNGTSACDNGSTPESYDVMPPGRRTDDRMYMEELMSTVRRNRCPICAKTFKRDLWSHMLVHTGERPFSCAVCHKGFTRKSSLSLHMKLHLSERPFRCSLCHKEFAQKSNFTIHMERHAKAELRLQHQRRRIRRKITEVAVSEEPSPRSENEDSEPAPDLDHERLTRDRHKCGEMYEAAQTLRWTTKNRNPGDRSEECPICGKSFFDLWPHMRLHTGERPFRCSVCRKGFPRRSSLTLHKRLHMKEKPFKCKICLKEFTQNNNFKRHMARHEKDDPQLHVLRSGGQDLSPAAVYLQRLQT